MKIRNCVYALKSVDRFRAFYSAAAITVVALCASPIAQAATGTWIGGSGNWDATATNWTGVAGTPWDAGNGPTNDAVFGGTAGTVSLTAGVTAHNINLNTTGYIIQNNTLTLAGTTPTVTINNNSSTFTINSVIAGNAGLAIVGPGNNNLSLVTATGLKLGGANTYTGNTSVTGGANVILNSTTGPAITGNITSMDGVLSIGQSANQFGANTVITFTGNNAGKYGVLELLGNNQTVRGISAGGSMGYIENTQSGASVGNSVLTINTSSGDNFTYAGFIRDAGAGATKIGITKSGLGTQVLNNVMTYTGNTSVTGGTLELGGSGTIYAPSSTQTISVSSNATLKISNANNNPLGHGQSQIWTVAGTLTEATAGVQIMPGVVNLNGGILTSTAGNATFGSFVVFNGDNTINANGTGNTISSVNFGINQNLTLNLNTPLVGDTLLGSTIFKDGSTTGGKLAKSGLGSVTLTNANTYTGTTTINAGTLQIGNGGGTGSLSTSSAITNNGKLTINRNVATTQGTHFSGAAITGSGSFTQAGTGTTTLSTNTYGGTTTVLAGTLSVTGSIANPGSDSVFIQDDADGVFDAASPTFLQAVAGSANYTGIGASSIVNTGNGIVTAAEILQGVNSGSAETLSLQFRQRITNELGGGGAPSPNALPPGSDRLVSDVLNLSGMSSSADLFVLQMSYDPNALPGGAVNESAMASVQLIYLGWLQGTQWKNAVLGNTGGTSSFTLGAYSDTGSAGLADDLGRWGVNTSTNTVWAVLNHNSQFAVVPEPGTFAMMLFGGVFLWFMRRK